MANIKAMIQAAVTHVNDEPSTLVCQVRHYNIPSTLNEDHYLPPITTTFDNLPTREFDASYGAEEGEQVICWSPRYVYIKSIYDGAESIVTIPRHPQYTNIHADHFEPVGGW